MQAYHNIEVPTQEITAQQEADDRWTCLCCDVYFTLSDIVFPQIFELNV